MPKAVRLPKVYDLQEWRVELLLRYARLHRFSTFKTNNKMKEKKWRIELTEHQLRLIANCVEDCHRFAAGQLEMIYTTACLEHPNELRHRLARLQPFVTPQLEQGYAYDWAGTHCPNNEQRKFIAETYYLYRKIVEEMTIERVRTKNNSLGNKYLSETLRCKDSGEPIKLGMI